MKPNPSSTPTAPRRSPRGEARSSPRPDRARVRVERRAHRERRVLGRYTDRLGHSREVIAQQGPAATVLVVDRDAATHDDRRLVAHLAADEPAENAAVVCSDYLQAARCARARCRRLTDEDAVRAPLSEETEAELGVGSIPTDAELVDLLGCAYRLELLPTRMSIPELRWCRHRRAQPPGDPEPVSLREAVARLESYEPVRTLTLRALASHRDDAQVSTAALRAELARVQASPIVLNRGLREVVLATIERQELSMSEIAIRCGRVKRDCKGNQSGETSWLARRLGLLPEGGQSTPTPWIHSDVLGLIARCGLGIGPREVELG